ncbi:MAG TPA: PDZ domain-containing protein [Candidatus Acidoferrum sp.]|nr:PDZ domain-containing protein [Candidatus Acidoferrum sp.]
MNKRILWLSICLALCITLATLPRSSVKVAIPDNAAIEQLPANLQQLPSRVQQASATFSNRAEVLSRLQDLQQVQASDDHDVEVFLGNNGTWLGVETREVGSNDVKSLKLPAERGVLVGKIIPDSPAAKAGLKENDVIVEVNGQRVEGKAQFHRMIQEIPAGRTAQVTILRDGHQETLNVTLGSSESNDLSHTFLRSGSPGSFVVRVPELPDIENLEEMNVFGSMGMGRPRMGIDAEDLRGALGNYFGAPEGEGVLVRNVFSGTPAEKAGLRAGDVITNMDGKRIRTISELREQLKVGKFEGKTMKVGLLRNKTEMTVDVYFPPAPKEAVHSRGERTTL